MTRARLNLPLTDEWLTLTRAEAAGDLTAWAQSNVDHVEAVTPGALTPRRAVSLLADLIAAGEHFAAAGGSGALLLVPTGELKVRSMVRIQTFNGPVAAEDLAAQCAELIPPAGSTGEVGSVEEILTAAGPATRLRLTFADSSGAGLTRETVFWLWWFPDVLETVLASVAFSDVRTAERWMGAVEELVVGIARDGGPDAQPGELAPEVPVEPRVTLAQMMEEEPASGAATPRLVSAWVPASATAAPWGEDAEHAQIFAIHPGEPVIHADSRGLAAASITVDRKAGTFTWEPDSTRRHKKGFLHAPLPGRGQDPVVKIVHAQVILGDPRRAGVMVERMLFIDEQSRALWTSRCYYPGSLAHVWPLDRLAELEDLGICAAAEDFETAASMNEVYPGAASHVRWLSPSHFRVTAPVAAAALAVVAGLEVALLTM